MLSVDTGQPLLEHCGPSFLIPLNLEKKLSDEQLVTTKLRNKGRRSWINQEPLFQGISRPKCAFVIFLLFPYSLSL